MNNQPEFHDLDCERALLGYLIYNPGKFYLVKETIECLDYFSAPAHRSIYEAMLDWNNENGDWTEMGLGKSLEKLGKLNECGGYAYLAELQALAPGSCHPPYYAKILRDHYLANKSRRLAGELMEKLSSPEAELEDAVNEAIEKFRDVQAKLGSRKNKIRTVAEVVPEVFREIMDQEKSGVSPALSTGIRALDAQYGGGLFAGCMNIIAGDPGAGKTSLALNIANHNARKIDILLVSLEATVKETVKTRLLPINTGVSSTSIREPSRLGSDEWERLMAGGEVLSECARFEICEDAFIDIEGIETLLINKVRSLKGRPLLFILDFIQRMKLPEGKGKMWEKFMQISVRLTAIIKELNIFSIIVAQLNRDAKKRNVRPIKEFLGQTSQLEKDAHTVLLVWETEGKTVLILDKNRDGPTGDVPLLFNKKYTRFKDAGEGGF